MAKYYTRSGHVARRGNKSTIEEVSDKRMGVKPMLVVWLVVMCISLGTTLLGLPVGMALVPTITVGIICMKQLKIANANWMAVTWVLLPTLLLGGSVFTTICGAVVLGLLLWATDTYSSYLWKIPNMLVFSTMFSTIYFLLVTPQENLVVWIVRVILDVVITSSYCLLLLEVARSKVKQGYLHKQ